MFGINSGETTWRCDLWKVNVNITRRAWVMKQQAWGFLQGLLGPSRSGDHSMALDPATPLRQVEHRGEGEVESRSDAELKLSGFQTHSWSVEVLRSQWCIGYWIRWHYRSAGTQWPPVVLQEQVKTSFFFPIHHNTKINGTGRLRLETRFMVNLKILPWESDPQPSCW